MSKARKEKLSKKWKDHYSKMNPSEWGGQVYRCVALGFFSALGCSFSESWDMCNHCKIQ